MCHLRCCDRARYAVAASECKRGLPRRLPDTNQEGHPGRSRSNRSPSPWSRLGIFPAKQRCRGERRCRPKRRHLERSLGEVISNLVSPEGCREKGWPLPDTSTFLVLKLGSKNLARS